MLADEIKKRMFDALKGKRDLEKEILRVALGEIQAAASRTEVPLTDEDVQKILRKLMKSNSETIAATDRLETRAKLEEENRILEELMPKRWDVDRIVTELAAVKEGIVAAKSEGQATGVAMKHLKSLAAPVEGKDVGEAVRRLRGG